MLVSEEVYANCRDRFYFQELDLIRVKGKTQSIAIYAPLNSRSDGTPPAWLGQWEVALCAYRTRDFKRARSGFADLLAQEPSLRIAAQLYVERCDQLITEPPPEDWDFVCVMRTK